MVSGRGLPQMDINLNRLADYMEAAEELSREILATTTRSSRWSS